MNSELLDSQLAEFDKLIASLQAEKNSDEAKLAAIKEICEYDV